MSSSMLHNDIDQQFTASRDVLSPPSERAVATSSIPRNMKDGGGDVEMSPIPSNNNMNTTTTTNSDTNIQEQEERVETASSHWVTSSNDKLVYDPSLRKDTISKTEVIICIIVVICLIAVTAIGVSVGVNKQNSKTNIPEELVGRYVIDPVTGIMKSNYILPQRPTGDMIVRITDQEELDIIRNELISNPVLMNDLTVPTIPNTVQEVTNTNSNDPYIQAAQWITTIDTVNDRNSTLARYTLAVLYYAMNGVGWYNNTNWLSSDVYYCDWYGITCCDTIQGSTTICTRNEFGRILEIDLYRNNVVGAIPNVLAILGTSLSSSSIYSIYMSENNITGTIAGSTYAALPNLGRLYLAYNQMSGTIPGILETSGKFSTLYTQSNNFTGDFPQELCSCNACTDKLAYFGLDCHKIKCSGSCCREKYECFYTN